jgi:pimeloyl-ACP methyl ester carboxylesterase
VTAFGLVHGAWHGAWCWERLAAELESLGHETAAAELPSDEPDSTLDQYAAVAAESLEGFDEPVVIVGHSLGGLTIPLVPALRPVSALVFLAAFVPRPGISAAEEFETGGFQLAPGFGAGRMIDDLGRSYWDPEKAAESFFGDLDPAEARAYAARLRPQGQRSQQEPHPLEAWPEVPSHFIHCARDASHTREFDEAHARERLGVEPLEIDSDHSPFLSHPRELAAILDGLAAS